MAKCNWKEKISFFGKCPLTDRNNKIEAQHAKAIGALVTQKDNALTTQDLDSQLPDQVKQIAIYTAVIIGLFLIIKSAL